MKHTVHLDKVKAEQFVLPIGKKKTHVIGINPSQITTEDLAVSLRPAANYVPTDGYSRLRLWSGIIIPEKSALQWQRGYSIETAQWHLPYPDSHNIIVIRDNDATWHWQSTKSASERRAVAVGKTARYSKRCRFRSWDLMSDAGFESVNETLGRMIKKAHEMGVPADIEPFITLSFLALPRHSDDAHYAARSVPADREGTGNSAGVKPVWKTPAKSFLWRNLWI